VIPRAYLFRAVGGFLSLVLAGSFKGGLEPPRLLLLLLLLLLLIFEAIESLPTKNFVELRSNDVGTTVGERGLIPGKAWT